jgi:hypothetical protein
MSERDVSSGNIRSVRLGSGANCSSIGSVIDTLFATATAGAAVFAAVVAALKSEAIRGGGAGDPVQPTLSSEPDEPPDLESRAAPEAPAP